MRWLDDLQKMAVDAETAVLARSQRQIDRLQRTGWPNSICRRWCCTAADDQMNEFEHGRYLAPSIRGARLVALESDNHIVLADEPAWPVLLRELTDFLAAGPVDAPPRSTGGRPRRRALAAGARHPRAWPRRARTTTRSPRSWCCRSARSNAICRTRTRKLGRAGPDRPHSRRRPGCCTAPDRRDCVQAATTARRDRQSCAVGADAAGGVRFHTVAIDQPTDGGNHDHHDHHSSNTSITGTAEDRALKAKHAAIWASGSYPTVVDDVVASLGGILVDALEIQPGRRVLDVAAGTGTSALPAARRGATVTATDLTPELLAVGPGGRRRRGTRTHLADRRRRGAALRRRRVRRRHVLHRGDVRPAPPAGRRRAGPRLPARRHDRRAQLDTGRLHRSDVRRP